MLAIALSLMLSAADTGSVGAIPKTPAISGRQARAKPPKAYVGWRRFGRWVLYVRGDPFAEQTACKVSASGMDYDHGVLTVRLGGDSFDAVYRIDNGPPIKATADTLAIAHRGLAVFQDDLASPSGGIVRIPGERIVGAHQVSIQLRRGGRVVTRRLGGLESILAAAQSYRCEGFSLTAPTPG